jgi:hypothetical protein
LKSWHLISNLVTTLLTLTERKIYRLIPLLAYVTSGEILPLTLSLKAVGRFAHTIFEGLFLKKSLSAKNRQKIPNPQKTPAESNSWVVNPSKNVNLCLFYASEQAKA